MKLRFIIILILTLCVWVLIVFSNTMGFSSKLKKEVDLVEKADYSAMSQHFDRHIPQTTVLAGGDVMLGRTVGFKMSKTNNFNWPFEKIAVVIRSADFSFFNLESPFYHDCPLTNAGMIFCADYRAVDGISFAGIDAFNLSNNHIKNYGEEGLTETKDLLHKSRIQYFGEGNNPLVTNLRGVRFAFLGFNEVGVSDQEYISLKARVQKEVGEARSVGDVVIVSFHWGQEYTKRTSSRQRELARIAIDNGADVVIGHHPHWTQGREIYQNKPVYYSLGNFIFDQMWSEETRKGVLLKMVFSGKDLISEELLPIEILDFGQPSLVYSK